MVTLGGVTPGDGQSLRCSQLTDSEIDCPLCHVPDRPSLRCDIFTGSTLVTLGWTHAQAANILKLAAEVRGAEDCLGRASGAVKLPAAGTRRSGRKEKAPTTDPLRIMALEHEGVEPANKEGRRSGSDTLPTVLRPWAKLAGIDSLAASHEFPDHGSGRPIY